MTNVLLTAVGRRAYLVGYFKHVLHPRGGKVYAVNTISDATGYLAADVAEVVPPSSSPDYIDILLELCRKWQVKLLFSLHDWDAPVIARARERFVAIGTTPVMGAPELLATCLDKYATANVLRDVGINVPVTVLRLEDAARVVEKHGFPLVVKPRWGQGSLGLFKVYGFDELNAAYYLANTAAKRFASICPEIRGNEAQVIIQQCVKGAEFGCDIINDLTGEYRCAFVKRKFAMRSGETDIAETVENPVIEEQAGRIGGWSRHLGCMDSDWIVDENGVPYLIELNPRFGGGYPFTHCAGADVVRACIDWADGIDDNAWRQGFKVGVRTYKEINLFAGHA